ncbi:MAG: hypothetical protein QM770_05415 [Tepidisphaeraceae bacterium]
MFSVLAQYSYRPFVTPLPIWDYWFALLVPLCIGVAVVYKSAKCHTMRDVPREASVITLWIIASMIGAAMLLVGVTWAVTPQ